METKETVLIKTNQLNKRYGSVPVVKDLNFRS